MADVARDDDDDPFEAQRANADDPMRRLFGERGRPNRLQFAVAVLAGIAARLLELLPPVLLGLAIDSIFRDDKPFSLGVLPTAWTLTVQSEQLLVTVGSSPPRSWSVIAITRHGCRFIHVLIKFFVA